jgi:hypothetical protein
MKWLEMRNQAFQWLLYQQPQPIGALLMAGWYSMKLVNDDDVDLLYSAYVLASKPFSNGRYSLRQGEKRAMLFVVLGSGI